MLALTLSLLAAPPMPIAAQSMVDVTPPGVDVDGRVSLDPRDPDHLLMEASGVLLESTDAGTTWQSLAAFPGNRGTLDANGDVVLVDTGAPLGSAPAIQRIDQASLVNIPPPAPGTLPEFAQSIVAHPTRFGTLALLTISDDPNSGEIISSLHVTEDEGTSWILVTTAITQNSGEGSSITDFEFVPTETGDGLLVSTRFDDLRFFSTETRLYGPGFQSFTSEVGAMDAFTGVSASRTLAGRRYAFVSNNPPFLPGAPDLLRRDPGGDYAPVGDPGFFRDVAAGNVDPELVLRLQAPVPGAVLTISRNAGQSWSLLADPTTAGFTVSEILGLTSTDGHAYVRALSSGSNSRRLLRIPVESVTGGEECAGVVNSTGRPGALTAVGRRAASANRFLLSIRDVPAHSCYLPLVSRDPGFLPNPGGSDGNLCLGGDIGRVLSSMGAATPWGESAMALDLTSLPGPNSLGAASAGETWRFQVWYRDCAAVGASNLTNSVVATFD